MWGWVRFLALFIFMVYTEKDYLMHYGRKGMKWYQHIYQNKDGGLTRAGLKKVEKSGSYLNASRKQIKRGKAKNREAVSNAYEKEYQDLINKYSKRGYWGDVPSEELDEIWLKYVGDWANATIKDLNLYDSQSARNTLDRNFFDQAIRETDIYWNVYRNINSGRNALEYTQKAEKSRQLKIVKNIYKTKDKKLIRNFSDEINKSLSKIPGYDSGEYDLFEAREFALKDGKIEQAKKYQELLNDYIRNGYSKINLNPEIYDYLSKR